MVRIYKAKEPGQIIDLELAEFVADLKKSGNYRVSAYVAKSLHCVVIGGAVYDMPESIRIVFSDEGHPVVRECFLLTIDLYEMILEKCAAAEAAFTAGQMTDVNWRILCHRMRDKWGVDDLARRYATARDFAAEPAAGYSS